MSANGADAHVAGRLSAALKRRVPKTPLLVYPPAIIVFLILLGGPVLAHGGEEISSGNWAGAWKPTPEVTLGTVLLLWIYIRGVRTRSRSVPLWRHAFFGGGVMLVFLSLQSPIDPIAERLFFMHQVQHMLLRIIGPMLAMLAQPQGLLTAGLPKSVRRWVLVPVMRSRAIRSASGVIRRPVPVFLIFVGSLYFWQVPQIHNEALVNDPLHYLMHVTMLAAGILFWATIFDPRDPPKGMSHRVRLLLLLGTVLSNMLLGSTTVLTTDVIYGAYDIEGRLFGLDPLTDEGIGGFLIWMPSSMMSLAAILITFSLWNRSEERGLARRYAWTGSNMAALEFPETAGELRLKTAVPNRRMAGVLAALSATAFTVSISVVVVVTAVAR